MFKNKEYVFLVYKERSFSKAAEKLHISQPSLSSTIKKLEDKIGLPIFNRKTNPISLTQFGVEYILSIEKIIEIENRMHSLVSDVDKLQKGHLSIGASSLSIAYFVPETIAAFKKAHPYIDLNILETSTLKSKQLLDTGEVDLIITNRPLDTKEYEKIFLYHEHLILAIPTNYPVNKNLKTKQLNREDFKNGVTYLLNKKSVPISEFADVPFIFLPKDNYLRFCTDMLFEEKKILPNIILEVEETATAYNFVQYGLGATIFGDTRVLGLNTYKQIAFYAINSKYAARDAFIYYKKSVLRTRAMHEFIEMAISRVKNRPVT